MPFALNISKSGEDPEVLENVTAQMAIQVFSALSWAAEGKAIQATVEKARKLRTRVLQLSEDEPLRILNLYPADENAVSVRMCTDEASFWIRLDRQKTFPSSSRTTSRVKTRR